MCGVCKPEYSMTTAGCSIKACPAEEQLDVLRRIAIGIAITVAARVNSLSMPSRLFNVRV